MNVSRRGFLTGGAAVVLSAPAIVRASSLMPIRVPRAFSLTVPTWCPPGFLPADGRTLPKDQYPGLWGIIGDTWGGDGVTSFNLPDLRSLEPSGRALLASSSINRFEKNATLAHVIDTKTGALQMVLATTS